MYAAQIAGTQAAHVTAGSIAVPAPTSYPEASDAAPNHPRRGDVHNRVEPEARDFRNSLVSETNAQVKLCDQSYWIKAGCACFCALKY